MSIADKITAESLLRLREQIKDHISGKRYSHTLAVEWEIINLCRIFSLSESETNTLRIAALLHDITKEKTPSEHMALCKENKIPFGADEEDSPKTFHAITAEAVIRKCFPEYAIDEILFPIRYHTTGRENMTLGEKLLYLADYIEETRTFPDCITLRQEFYGVEDPSSPEHLDNVLISSFKMIVRNLLEENAVIHPATISSLNSLIRNKKNKG